MVTNRLVQYVIDKLRDERSLTNISREVNLSVTTVIRYFDLIKYLKATSQHRCLSTNLRAIQAEKNINASLSDPVNKVVFDILLKRYKAYLTDYFRQYPLALTCFVSDMWRTYANISDV